MTTPSHASGVLFDGLQTLPPDPALSVRRLFREDRRSDKIDLIVGGFRDARGQTPVFEAIKTAERRLWETLTTKAPVGAQGDLDFLERLALLVFGKGLDASGVFAVQTPGGAGALRLAAELASRGKPGARVWLGAPNWPVQAAIFADAGLHVVTFRHFDATTQTLLFDEMVTALESGAPGDVVVLHGCCHFPTGADPDPEQWRELAGIIASRGLVPLVDLAFQGLGDGLEEDAASLRIIMEAVDNAFVAYSCSKNFGIYRERTGALFVRARGHSERVRANALKIARCAWSMPPDHGTACVRLILEDPDLSAVWRAELAAQRRRLGQMREMLANADARFEAIRSGRGLHALLALTPSLVERLREDYAVYMPENGQINIAGLTEENLERFATAYAACSSG